MKKLKPIWIVVISIASVLVVALTTILSIVLINKKQVLTTSMVTLEATSYVYDGTEKKPSVKVTLKGKTLTSDNYTVTYQNNVNIGTASVTVSANKKSKKIKGSVTVNFSITQAEIFADLNFNDVVFNGENKKPTIELQGYQENTDYTISWLYKSYLATDFTEFTGEEFTDAGIYKVIVKGIGNFSGEVSETFEIKRKVVEKPTILGTYTYNGEAQTAELSLTNPLIYEVTGNTQTNAGNYIVTVSLVNENNYVWAVTNTTEDLELTFVISALNLETATVDLEYESVVYSKEENTPTVSVSLNSKVLVKDTDFTVSYKNNVNAGTASIEIIGKDNYTGKITKTFEILKAEVVEPEITGTYSYNGEAQEAQLIYNDATLFSVTGNIQTAAGEYDVVVKLLDDTNYIWKNNKNSEDLVLKFNIDKKSIEEAVVTLEYEETVYTGEELTPTVSVVLSEKTLILDTDFEVSYLNNVNSGTAIVEIVGKGNYVDSVSKTFEITPVKVLEPTVVGTYIFNGKPQTIKLSYESDLFEVSENVQTNVGNYHLIVKLAKQENYVWENNENTDDLKLDFEILAKDINELDFSLEYDSVSYDGEEKTPEVTLKFEDLTLEKDTDYVVSYLNNSTFGTATVIVEGKGNYLGTIETTFEITAQEVEEPEVSGTYTYNGLEQTISLSYTSDLFTVENNKATNVGKYELVVKLNNANCVWKNKKTNEDLVLNFEILAKDINLCTVELEYESIKYTGAELKPVVSVFDGDNQLEEGTDFEISYVNNINIGTATVEITGKGNYNLVKTTTFEILPEIVEVPKVVGTYVYTGSPLTADLSYTSDLFEVKNSTQTFAGSYKITVSLTNNNYVWATTSSIEDIELDFVIDKANYSNVTVSRENYTFGDEPTNIQLSENVEGEVKYYYSTTNDLTNGVEFNDKTIFNNGTYYFYAEILESDNFYAFETEVSTFEVSKINLSVAEVITSEEIYYYTGLEVVPEITVKLNGNIVDAENYDVVYSNNIKIGNGKITVTGKGNYSGTVTTEFEITYSSEPCEKHTDDEPIIESFVRATSTKDGGYDTVVYCSICGTETSRVHTVIEKIDLAKISIDTNDVVYNKTEQKPSVVVETYKLNEDYTISYKNNTNVGEASVVLTFIGNYDDILEYNFNILPVTVINPTIFGTYIYNGKEQKATLNNNSNDFIVTNDTYKNAGKYKITVELKDTLNYVWKDSGNSENLELDFEILRKDLSSANLTLEYESVTFNNTELKPELTVVLDSVTLKLNEEYQISYKNNKNNGTAIVEIVGVSNYQGTASVTFEILKLEVEEPIVKDSYAFNEAEQTILKDTDYYSVKNATLTNAGTYDIIVTLKDKTNYVWKTRQDNEDLSFVVTITAGIVSEPEITKEFTYTGEEHVAVIENLKYYSVSNHKQTNVGKYFVTISLTDPNNYVWEDSGNNLNLVYEFEIKEADISLASYKLEKESFECTGTFINPEFTLTFNNKTLVLNDDYTADVLNNINVGKGRIVVTGKGNFTGTKEIFFDITPTEIDVPTIENVPFNGYNHTAIEDTSIYVASNAVHKDAGTYEVTLSIKEDVKQNYIWSTTKTNEDVVVNFTIEPISVGNINIMLYQDLFEYTNAEIVDVPHAANFLSFELFKGKDYEFEFKNNKYAGTATIIVKGIGNFVGEKTIDFTITPKKITEPTLKSNVIYNGKEQSAELDYYLDGVFTLSNETYKDAGTYYITVSLEDVENYIWERADNTDDLSIKFVIEKCYIDKPVLNGVYTYTGNSQNADLLYFNEKTMDISGQTQTDAGEYDIIVSLKDDKNYAWIDKSIEDVEIKFNIAQRSIIEATVTLESNEFNFTGNEICPTVEVVFNEKVLVEGKDYNIRYLDNTEVGQGLVVIEGIGNFSNVKSVSFDIVTGKILKKDVVLSSTGGVYTGENLMPTVTVYYLETELVLNRDYQIEWLDETDYIVSEIVNGGTYTLKVYGLNNYESNVEIEFIVEKIDYKDVSVTRNNYVYGDEPSQIILSGTIYGTAIYYYSLTSTGEELIEITQSTVLDAGNYYLFVKVVESKNYNEYIQAVGTPFEVSKANRYGISLSRSNYDFGTPSEIKLIGYDADDIKFFYYNENDSVENAQEFNNETVFNNGRYIIFAKIPGSKNYNEYISSESSFEVFKIDYAPNITISREDYSYAGEKTETILTGFNFDMSLVTFYYNLVDSNYNGIAYTDSDTLNAGIYYIYAVIVASDNYKEYRTLTYEFEVLKETYSDVTVERESYKYGEQSTPIILNGEVFGNVTYYYNTENVAENGVEFNDLTKFNAGTYYIYAVIEETQNYNGFVTETYEFVVEYIVVTNPTVQNKTFNGFLQTLITQSDMYTVSNNLQIDAGEYDVVVSLVDAENYIWSETGNSEKLNLTISILKVDMSDVEVEISNNVYDYDGFAKTPNVTATLNSYTLSIVDYQVEYIDNINAGQASVIVSAVDDGNFKGQVTLNFTINKISYENLFIICENYSYGMTCPVTLSKDVEGTIKYYYNTENSKEAAVEFDTDLILEVDTYYIYAVIEESQNYNRYETEIYSFAVNNAILSSAIVTVEKYYEIYTGSEVSVNIQKVEINGLELTLGTDYIVEIYNKNNDLVNSLVNIGVYTVKINGVNNYSGTYEFTFKIIGSNIEEATITIVGGEVDADGNICFDYTGFAIRPAIIVKIADMELEYDVDYTYYYSNNVNVGTASIVVSGINLYEGSQTVKYKIVLDVVTLEDATISKTTFSYTYSKSNVLNKISGTYTVSINGIQLTENVDYEIIWTDSNGQVVTSLINADVYTGTIQAIASSNYEGTASQTITVTINAKRIMSSFVTLSSSSIVYTGDNVTPTITVKDSVISLVEGVDYTLVITDENGTEVTEIVEVGTYTITISGIENYRSSVSKTFTVTES